MCKEVLTLRNLQWFEQTNNESRREELQEALKHLNRKIVVLDDDPTGIQTVHHISVYTDTSVESIRNGFLENGSMFYILTNSRSLTADETAKLHREIALNILKVFRETGKDFIIISRGDSTLRGHYPLETEILKDTLEQELDIQIDGEVFIPFFKEGGRITLNNVHYVQEEDTLIPVALSEFAMDKTFGYRSSHLGEYIEEKTQGRYKKDAATYIPIESLRRGDVAEVVSQLMKVKNYGKVIVNAMDDTDVITFTIALVKAMNLGKRYLFRTAASFAKTIGGITDQKLLTQKDLIREGCRLGGLIVVGSHVKKTTEQLNELQVLSFIEPIEFNQHLVFKPEELNNEIERVTALAEAFITEGKTAVVYTKRERIDLRTEDKEQELLLAVKISEAITSIVKKLSVRPSYIIAKGGITSSDIATKGLGVKKAMAAGQIMPGIPVLRTGKESKFPDISYIIFPGNVGTKNTLKEVVQMLNHQSMEE